jgi:phosphatidylglycerophosphate synthase
MSQGIEPEVKDFLRRVMQTVSVGMLFLLIHMTFGLYLNWGFYEGQISIGNIIYYIFLLTSFAAMIYYFYQLWKDRLKDKQ